MQIKALAAVGVLALLTHAPAAKAAQPHIQLTQYYDPGDEGSDRQYDRGEDGGYDPGDAPGYERGTDYGQYVPRHRPMPPVYRGVSCWRGARFVERAGYYRVRMMDCEGPVYAYRAVRRERAWIVRVSARTGQILSVRPVYRRY